MQPVFLTLTPLQKPSEHVDAVVQTSVPLGEGGVGVHA